MDRLEWSLKKLKKDCEYIIRAYGTLEHYRFDSKSNAAIEEAISRKYADIQKLSKGLAKMYNLDGGPGSGHWGHSGRPGEVGGSAEGGGVAFRLTTPSGGFTGLSGAYKENVKRSKGQSSEQNNKEKSHKITPAQRAKLKKATKTIQDLNFANGNQLYNSSFLGYVTKKQLDVVANQLKNGLDIGTKFIQNLENGERLVEKVGADAFKITENSKETTVSANTLISAWSQKDASDCYFKRLEPATDEELRPPKVANVDRAKPMTQEQANEGHCNPVWANLKAPKFNDEKYKYNAELFLKDRREWLENKKKFSAYGENCQTCVVAYEMRLRGYDVQAFPNDKAHPKLEELSYETNRAWLAPECGGIVPSIKRPPKSVTTEKKGYQWLEENIKPSQRYTFEFPWKGKGNYAHIISCSRTTKGEIELYDPQCGERHTGKEAVTNYLKEVSFRKSWKPGILRVDNLAPNPDFVDAVLTKGGTS